MKQEKKETSHTHEFHLKQEDSRHVLSTLMSVNLVSLYKQIQSHTHGFHLKQEDLRQNKDMFFQP